eukprot:62116_1
MDMSTWMQTPRYTEALDLMQNITNINYLKLISINKIGHIVYQFHRQIPSYGTTSILQFASYYTSMHHSQNINKYPTPIPSYRTPISHLQNINTYPTKYNINSIIWCNNISYRKYKSIHDTNHHTSFTKCK